MPSYTPPRRQPATALARWSGTAMQSGDGLSADAAAVIVAEADEAPAEDAE
jgi:hypothetical protein